MRRICIFLLVILLAGCTQNPSKMLQTGEYGNHQIAEPTNPSLPQSGGLSGIHSFAYQLQDFDIPQAAQTNFDLFIMDYSKDGSEESVFSSQELQELKKRNRTLLAYMSIGEAEDYRWYWDEAWDSNTDGIPDSNAPSWLGPSNPDWEGNYKVRYWDPQWKSLIFGTKDSYLDKIIDAGFDGAYLDIVDGYEYWGPGGESGLNRDSAKQEMVDFVKELSTYAHVNLSKPDFLIVPQNGEALGAYPEYLEVVDGIGKEDTWYMDNIPNDPSVTREILTNLDRFSSLGKFVLVTDYVTEPEKIDDFYSKAAAKGYIPYATTRELDSLTLNAGHKPQ